MRGQPLDLPLVGRAKELRALREARHLARMGPHRLLLLSGESGAGTSRLLKALGMEAQREGRTHAAGSVTELHQGRPNALLSGALAPLVRTLSPGALAVLSRGTDGELAALFPSLRPRADTRRGVEELSSASFAKLCRELVRLPNVSHQVLAPPGDGEVAALLRQALGAASPHTEDLARRLHRHTGGNAFFLQEVLRALALA